MMVYFFIFDHIYDTDTLPSSQLGEIRSRLAPSVLASIDGRAGGSSQIGRAIDEILLCFESEDAAWLAGFSSRLRRYVEATLAGKQAALTRPETSLEEYLEIREHDSGGLWSAYLIEYAHRRYLTPTQRAHPEVSYASRLCMWICSLLNDLFSYAKEKATEVAPFNAVYFAMTSRGLEEDEAAVLVCERVNRYLAEFEARIASPVFHTDETIVSYAQGLREFISGVWFWHQKCGLYNDPRSLFFELRGLPNSQPAYCSPARPAAVASEARCRTLRRTATP